MIFFRNHVCYLNPKSSVVVEIKFICLKRGAFARIIYVCMVIVQPIIWQKAIKACHSHFVRFMLRLNRETIGSTIGFTSLFFFFLLLFFF